MYPRFCQFDFEAGENQRGYPEYFGQWQGSPPTACGQTPQRMAKKDKRDVYHGLHPPSWSAKNARPTTDLHDDRPQRRFRLGHFTAKSLPFSAAGLPAVYKSVISASRSPARQRPAHPRCPTLLRGRARRAASGVTRPTSGRRLPNPPARVLGADPLVKGRHRRGGHCLSGPALCPLRARASSALAVCWSSTAPTDERHRVPGYGRGVWWLETIRQPPLDGPPRAR